MKKFNSERASILVGVLWSLFFLAALALAINAYVTPQITLAAKLRDRVITHYLAKAGIKRAIVELREDETEEYDALNESWSQNEEEFKEVSLTDEKYFSLEYSLNEDEEGGEYEGFSGSSSDKRYGLIDEERKININRASAGVLNQFFTIVGEMSSQDATDLAESIIDWRDKDDDPLDYGAESSYYESLDPPYACKNARFDRLEELLLVKGMTQDIFDKAKNKLTIFGKGEVNINTADEVVLQSLGMSGDLAAKIVTYRKGNDGVEATEDDNIFEHLDTAITNLSAGQSVLPSEVDEFEFVIEEGLVTVRSDYFQGHSLGGLRDAGVSTEIVFIVDREEQIRYWREY